MSAWGTYWVTVYLEVKNRLKELLEELLDDEGLLGTEGDPVFKAVYFGKKSAPKEFPACVLWPILMRPSVTTAASSQYPIRFRVAVIAQDQSPEGGHDEAIGRLGIIGAMIVNDRQFGHLVATTEIDEIDPDVMRRRVRTRHEAAFILRFERFVLPV